MDNISIEKRMNLINQPKKKRILLLIHLPRKGEGKGKSLVNLIINTWWSIFYFSKSPTPGGVLLTLGGRKIF